MTEFRHIISTYVFLRLDLKSEQQFKDYIHHFPHFNLEIPNGIFVGNYLKHAVANILDGIWQWDGSFLSGDKSLHDGFTEFSSLQIEIMPHNVLKTFAKISLKR